MAYITLGGKLVRIGKGRPSVMKIVYAKSEADIKAAKKGVFGENCNVTHCQKPGAFYYNVGSRAFYCRSCAFDINHDGCRRFNEPDICFLAVPKAVARAAQYKIGWIGESEVAGYHKGKLGVLLEDVRVETGRLGHAGFVLKGRLVHLSEHSDHILFRADQATSEQMEVAEAVLNSDPAGQSEYLK